MLVFELLWRAHRGLAKGTRRQCHKIVLAADLDGKVERPGWQGAKEGTGGPADWSGWGGIATL